VSQWSSDEVRGARQAASLSRGVLAGVLFVVLLSSCGKWPPVVHTAADVARLPVATTSVRARALSDADVRSLERLRNLAFLDFFGGYGVEEARLTDDGVRTLASLDLPRLDTLHIGLNQNITDACLTSLLEMKQVRYLGLAACPGITDSGLEVVARMGHLQGLDLRGNPSITDVGIERLRPMVNLKTLLLDGCQNVTRAAERLRGALPVCVINKNDSDWKYLMDR